MGDIRALGYITIDTTELDRWRTLAFDVLDLGEGADSDDDTLYLRTDERAHRLVIRRSDTDRLTAMGWEVRDELALDRVRATLREHGVDYRDLSTDEARARKVDELIALDDPTGQPLEIFHGAGLDHSPVSTKHRTEFVTDELGLGHIVIPSTDHEATIAFYRDVLGFHTRGAFPFPPMPGMPPLRIQFMGVNPRHHSFAVMPSPQMGPGIVHIMLEVTEMDRVAQAMERTTEHGFAISSTLGRHTNDKMVSYYLRAPGGWDIEYGYDGLTVDENQYLPQLIAADSYWGHDWSGSEPLACTLPPGSPEAEAAAENFAEPIVENA
ncbi:VOC family protein [Dietzia sp. ANT_WB102]|uniref:VOC family protein n=1 Tax=Dietzia sp. ANT_WB102 TaxID=2597345 RepID=UPI0011ED4C70|nr:VOC family protein [Dietzia sp. ANT_WB102]KAA0918030.1 2,3-dihydroxybiphenyl 1,2-dioxygenase [Dietzia sp. ANT_WB102]